MFNFERTAHLIVLVTIPHKIAINILDKKSKINKKKKRNNLVTCGEQRHKL